jgi:ATP-dependent Clp protease ATP-binding subunit ClpC
MAFELFTDRARKIMALANQEAQRLNDEYIRTEHMLLGLLAEDSCTAVYILKELNVDIQNLRLDIKNLVRSASISTKQNKSTPSRAKFVIECALEEARGMNFNYVGTEHILLGLLREKEGVAAQVLIKAGLNLEIVRNKVLIRSKDRFGDPNNKPDSIFCNRSQYLTD